MSVISGLGWITASGIGTGREQDNFQLSTKPLPAIERQTVFAEPYKNFGRMDPYSKLGVSCIALALRDAGLEQRKQNPDMAVVVSTEFGCLDTDIAYYQTVIPHSGTQASPNLFAYTLPNCFLGEVSIRFGVLGESYVLSDPSGTGLISIHSALDHIRCGDAAKVLCGVCDLGRPPLLTGAVETTTGAVMLVIEKQKDTTRPPYGELHRSPSGTLTFSGTPITNLTELVQHCLAHRTHKP